MHAHIPQTGSSSVTILPAPAFPAVSSRTFRWGIIGAGAISTDFCHALHLHVQDAVVQHVGARSSKDAQALATRFGTADTRFGSYEDVANDPLVDVVYVGTIHTLHKEHALLAISRGKAVLVEKPFCVNAAEAEEVLQAARDRGVFCMEAMKVRCFPWFERVLQLVREERVLGRVHHVTADLCFRFPPSNVRIFDPALAGGALLDVGCYPLYFVSAIHGGPPSKVTAVASLTPEGVDGSLALALGWDQSRTAQCFTSVLVDGPREVHVLGEEGRLLLRDANPMRGWNSSPVLLLRRKVDGQWTEERIALPVLAEDQQPWNGSGRANLAYEAVEVQRCLAAGKKESEKMPCSETLALMRVMDDVRRQVGVTYPSEK